MAGTVDGFWSLPPVSTRTSANDGMYFATGSVRASAPSSYSIMAATEVTGLVIEYQRQRVSVSTGRPDSMSRRPYDPTCTSLPPRLTVSSQPGSSPSSTYRAKCRSIRASRPASNPASPGSTSTFSPPMNRLPGCRVRRGNPRTPFGPATSHRTLHGCG